MEAAQEMRENACARVIAMLVHKEDAAKHSESLADLVRAVELSPVVVAKPTVRIDLCVAMLVIGAVFVLLVVHLCKQSDTHGEAKEREKGRETFSDLKEVNTREDRERDV